MSQTPMFETPPVPAPAEHGTAAPIVVMGVSGAGKTLIGRMLAERLGVRFVDGDDLHGEANRRKLSTGEPLTDEDRWPWLDAVGGVLRRDDHVAVACSALKRSYRDRLRLHRPDVVLVHLDGDAEILEERVHDRTHAFMPADLLASQIATLEPLENDEAGLVVDIELAPEQIVDRIVEWVAASGASKR